MVNSKSVRHLGNIKVQNDWETPWHIFESICITHNVKPTLDVCATNRNTKCAHYFSERENGLQMPWPYPFWCNPPYDEVAIWVARAASEAKKHNVTGVLLTYAKTDTKWWHEFVEGHDVEVHFKKGRIKFLLPHKAGSEIAVAIESKHSAPYPSVVLIWRAK